MTRKDTEKEAERPHYYSQFWLDVAAGRRVIGTPRTGEEAEPVEAEVPEPVAPRRGARAGGQDEFNNVHPADGQTETIVHPVAEPLAAPDEYIEPEAESDEDLVAGDEDLDEQNMVVADADIPDMDLSETQEEEEEEEEQTEEEPLYDDEEEEEEDLGWGGARGRKKGKPGRQIKQPPKKSRRDPRRY
jgi:hypothetical protein